MLCILWYTKIFFAKGDLVQWYGCRDILCLRTFGTMVRMQKYFMLKNIWYSDDSMHTLLRRDIFLLKEICFHGTDAEIFCA
jgi:hypothetical protein